MQQFKITEDELARRAGEIFRKDGMVLLMYTSRFSCEKYTCGQDIPDVSRLLEVRIFDEGAELKLMRTDRGNPFFGRLADDTGGIKPEEYLDEEQFLDAARSEGNTYHTTTGGGEYTLPVENAKKVKIRNYITYDDHGIAQVTDFRIVGFIT